MVAVTPISTTTDEVVEKICGICLEVNAKIRICCSGAFCDHCYTKNKSCPGKITYKYYDIYYHRE